jgi:hypothetical protein
MAQFLVAGDTVFQCVAVPLVAQKSEMVAQKGEMVAQKGEMVAQKSEMAVSPDRLADGHKSFIAKRLGCVP